MGWVWMMALALGGHADLPTSDVAAASTADPLDHRVARLASAVRRGDGAAAHQLGDLALARGHRDRAMAWYLAGAELGDSDARGHVAWLLPLLTSDDWAGVDLARAHLDDWLQGPRPAAWLPIDGPATARSEGSLSSVR